MKSVLGGLPYSVPSSGTSPTAAEQHADIISMQQRPKTVKRRNQFASHAFFFFKCLYMTSFQKRFEVGFL
jgi:hypothetical protein